MAAKDLALRILISAQDAASSVFSALTGRVAQLGAALAGFFGLRALGSYFAEAVETAAGLERELGILAQVSGASAAELADLKAAAEAVAASSLPYTARQAAAAETELAKAGLSARQVIDALAPTLALASAAQLDVSESAAIVTRTLSTFGLAASEAARVANTLVAGANASNTSVQGLGEALSYAGPIAAATGYSLQDLTTYIGVLANRGIDASRAGTALASILSQLADPASAASTALSAMGVTSRDLDSVIKALATGTPMAQKAIQAFGLEAGPALRSLVATGAAGLQDLGRKVQGVGDEAAQAAAAMQNNLLGAFEALGSIWETIKQKFGEGFLGPVTRETKALTAALQTWLSSGQLEQIRAKLVAAFEAGAKAVAGFIKDFDVSRVLDGAASGVKALAERIAAWQGAVESAGQTVSRVGGGITAVWGGIRTGVAAVGFALAKLVEGAAWAQVQIDKLGLASADAVKKNLDAYAASQAASAAWKEAMSESANTAGAGWDRLTRSTEQARAGQAALTQEARAGTTAATEQARAATQAAAATKAQADAQAAAAAALKQETDAIQAASAPRQERLRTLLAEALASGNSAAAARLSAAIETEQAAVKTRIEIATQKATRAQEDQTAAAKAAADATENETLAAGRAAMKAQEEALARKLVIDALQVEISLRAGATRLIEQEGQVRTTHLANLAAEAQARGDLAEAARLTEEADWAAVRAAREAAAARRAEAETAEALAVALALQAQAVGDTSAETRKAVVESEQAARAKRLEAQAADEVTRHLAAMAEQERILAETFREAGQVGVTSIQDVLNAVRAATSSGDLEALGKALKDAFDQGALGAEQYQQALDQIKARQDDLLQQAQGKQYTAVLDPSRLAEQFADAPNPFAALKDYVEAWTKGGLGSPSAFRGQIYDAVQAIWAEAASTARGAAQEAATGASGAVYQAGRTAGSPITVHLGGVLDISDRGSLEALASRLSPIMADLSRRGA